MGAAEIAFVLAGGLPLIAAFAWFVYAVASGRPCGCNDCKEAADGGR